MSISVPSPKVSSVYSPRQHIGYLVGTATQDIFVDHSLAGCQWVVQNGDVVAFAVAQHAWQKSHQMNWDSAQILAYP